MHSQSSHSVAAPGGAQDAPRPSATIQAPVTPRRGAAIERGDRNQNAGVGAPGAGIAGMAGSASAARPQDLPADARTSGEDDPSGSGSGSGGSGGEHEPRTVLHADIDAFFASIEQQRDPRLRGKPVIVGAGVIASCSYEARAFGLKAGMALSEARRLCPDAVVLAGHAQVYRCFAERIFDLCRTLSPDVETYLDEAYLELTGTERVHGDFVRAAEALREAVARETGITVTCGIGPNRMLAKLVGKTVKPDGLARLHAHEADAFIVDRPIEQLAGVGHAHARTLRSMNVRTIGELRAFPSPALEALFGAPGRLLYERCRGRDTAPVVAREIPVTISRETSFHRDTAEPAQVEGMLEYLVGRACRATRELGLTARTVSVRLRYSDGESAEQSRTLRAPSAVDPVLMALALELLGRLFTRRVSLHAIGVTLSGFVRDAAEQGALFDEPEAGRRAALCAALDDVRDSYGHGAVVSGRALHLADGLEHDRYGFVLRTSSLTK
ncbi:MAG: DNA polymerase IV [Candidatus Eisenbacteria bacterium]|uniref:DNA polymerase IV n=1 Tax=Eiseniibacteriota bacterium TaxID=2212470 RepID=A0A933S8X0_UNCEI|nr:DNA polymerase IV [Candidatus Eisenbacteria bacterium]